jgi:hypothetical protein
MENSCVLLLYFGVVEEQAVYIAGNGILCVVFLVYACSSLSVFVVVPCCGYAVDYIEVPCYLRSFESGAQLCCPLSLFER